MTNEPMTMSRTRRTPALIDPQVPLFYLTFPVPRQLPEQGM